MPGSTVGKADPAAQNDRLFPLTARPMSSVQEPTLHERVSQAFERRAYREAYELLADADALGALSPEELELLAQAAWWIGRLPQAIEVRERAYAGAMKAGDGRAAVIAAINLGRDNLLRNAIAVSNAWLNRAERLLHDAPEGVAHGWLAATRSFYHALSGDSDAALAAGERAYEIGSRFGDTDLQAMALSERGAALVMQGRVEEGLAAIDEAAVAAVGGELAPDTAGGVCCTTIESCAALGEWQRASEWTEAQDRWCKREGINGYPGMCRVYRSQIKRMRGAWLEAEAEARQATEELQGFIPAAVGQAFYQIGEIRLLRGDLPGAEEALLRGHAYGRFPEPALSLLRLAQGRVDAAQAAIRRALDDPVTAPWWGAPTDSELYRLALLPARIEISLAADDLTDARAAVDEITGIAERFPTAANRAAAAMATGSVLLAEDDASGAVHALRNAARLWSELDAPHEAARARLRLGEALSADGSADSASLELRVALDAFERLGAAPDARRTRMLLREAAGEEGRAGEATAAGTARSARAFVFTDIVDSTRLAELLGDEAWGGVLRWHDETLRALVAEHGGEEVKRTGDGFFLAFADASRAIGCAVAIQRRLARQRETQGFAPSVRIGIHWSEATPSGLDYIGGGVNQAARIGAAASGDEILVSAATLAGVRGAFSETGRRTLELKGISEPVEVVSIGWR
jgi:class 3 adenylate cyclase